MNHNFNEKTTEYSSKQKTQIPVIQSDKYYQSKKKAIEIIEKYDDIEDSDFWILMNETKTGKMMYSGLIISHNGCLKINDHLDSKFVPSCVTLDKDGYKGSLVYTYCNDDQGIYEVGEVSSDNCRNSYPYAMAYKRLFDRVVLKLSKLAYSGVYSDSVIIGTVTLTSLGLNMGHLILQTVPKNIYITGFLVMIMSTILGMGVPGVAAYVIVQAVAVPVLIKVGIMPLAAHMFCLIYACLSNITPPVAISCYVAAGIARSNQLKTGLIAVRLGLIGFLMPFFFLGNPILLIGADPSASVAMTLWTSLTASIGTIALVAGLEGWFIEKTNLIQRLLLIALAPLFLYPGLHTDYIGFAILAIVVIWQILSVKIHRPVV